MCVLCARSFTKRKATEEEEDTQLYRKWSDDCIISKLRLSPKGIRIADAKHGRKVSPEADTLEWLVVAPK